MANTIELKQYFDNLAKTLGIGRRQYPGDKPVSEMAAVLLYLVRMKNSDDAKIIFQSFKDFLNYANKTCPELKKVFDNNYRSSHSQLISLSKCLPNASESEIFVEFWNWVFLDRGGVGRFRFSSESLNLNQQLIDAIQNWLEEPGNPYQEPKYEVTSSGEANLITYNIAKKGYEVFLSNPLETEARDICEILGSFMPNLRVIEPGTKTDFNGAIYLGPFGGYQGNNELAKCLGMLSWIEAPSIFAFSHSSLFKSSKTDIELKKSIIETGYLKAIILLKPGMLVNSNILTALALFNKRPNANSELFMVDASGDLMDRMSLDDIVEAFKEDHLKQELSKYAVKVTLEQLRAQDWILDPKRYLRTPEEILFEEKIEKSSEKIRLMEFAEIIRPISTQRYFTSLTVQDESLSGTECREVTAGDINEVGVIEFPEKQHIIYKKEFLSGQVLKRGDIVFAIKGSVGKVGIMNDDYSVKVIAGQSMVIIRPRSGLMEEAVYLHQYLRTNLIQTKIKRLSVGQVIQNLKIKDIENLWILSPNDQRIDAARQSFDEQVAHQNTIKRAKVAIRHLQENGPFAQTFIEK